MVNRIKEKQIKEKNRLTGLLEIHVGVLLFGIVGLFGKLIDLPAMVIVFGRVLFASVSLFLVLLVFGGGIRLKRKRDYFYIGGLGFILAIHWTSFFKSIQLSSVAVGLLTFSTFPVFVAFLEPLLFKEKLEFKSVLLAMVALGGVAFIVPEFRIENSITRGAFWGVVSGFTFALLSVLNRKFVKHYSGYIVAFYQDLGAALVLFPLIFLFSFDVSRKDIWLLLLLGIVFTGLAHSLFIGGLKFVKSRAASIIGTLEPVYGIIAALIVLGEIPPLRVVVGGIIIIGVALYETVSTKSSGY